MPVFWRGPSKGCPHTIRVCIGRAMSFVPRQLCVTPVQACAGHASLSVVARRFAAGEGVRRTKAESGLAGTLLPGQGTITHIMQAGKGGGGARMWDSSGKPQQRLGLQLCLASPGFFC